MKNKTCFVISPIGEKDSDIRKHADAFLKLLVEPGLAEFGFDIVRADQIASSSVITNDIVEYVQQSELCLVDLSFHNPNVFYECGRRHENGRPTIQLIKKGESLPFDVAGIRTIQYDLSDPWTTLESVNTIKEFIKQLEDSNSYGEKSSGVSLSTIAETLHRIEKKLSKNMQPIMTSTGGQIGKKELLTMHPVAAFHKCIEVGDIDSAKFVLSRLKMLPEKRLFVEALALLAGIGDSDAKSQLISFISNELSLENESDGRNAMHGLKEFYVNTNTEKAGLVELDDVFKKYFSIEGLPSKSLAFVYNIKQTLEYGAGLFEQALSDGLKAVELRPMDESYWYNVSLCYEKLERYDDAANAAANFVKYNEEPSPHHIEHVKEVFSLAGRESEVEELFNGTMLTNA
ncbi:hypothetical protein PRUB_a0703 [Pseudoalteromonas rubra]|uniref:DUF4071 domain-containing protein n=1 Tax=Pseudoalteromonas rubra TaxID=43658 RepID=A0A8T0C8C1_9GAMM|nr:hypothetical protein [Pseudoalteromonas rubra]KAF7786215.1 hypothetical protein PRUB_a0703 [Pseudoalteromonas rubra]